MNIIQNIDYLLKLLCVYPLLFLNFISIFEELTYSKMLVRKLSKSKLISFFMLCFFIHFLFLCSMCEAP